ncbi:MAG TPA: CocE/NonD family hydrolase, partial [Deltaproteobacteria bacterium]|nr:CocE/NonD family hydrolase [Deltaproteobacteria bacterium]
GNAVLDASGRPATMRGVDLWASLLRPAGTKKLPTIVIASAYTREVFLLEFANLVQHDYNILAVDIRGTGSAGGEWGALDFPEHYDIAYVIDRFIPAQSWSDGRVGMVGPSYLAITQLLAAGCVERNADGEPAHLKAIFPMIPMSDAYRDIVRHGGLFDAEFMLLWMGITDMCGVFLPNMLYLGDNFNPTAAQIAEAQAIWREHINAISTQVGWYFDNVNLVERGQFYDTRSPMIYWPVKPDPGAADGGWSVPEGGKTIPPKLPVFLTGGWYCIFTSGEVNTYQYGLARHAIGDKALMVGPWYHLDAYLNLGLNAGMFNSLMARWFDLKIKGAGASFTADYPVFLYVMGLDRWRAEKSWPLPASRVQDKTYYLTRAKASSIADDWFSESNKDLNFLLTDRPNAADYSGPDPVLVHDPTNLHGINSNSPVRWSMGIQALIAQVNRYLLGNPSNGNFFDDERKNEVGGLTFTTEVLEEDVEIVGPLKLTFWATTQFARLAQPAIDASMAFIKQWLTLDDTQDFIMDILSEPDVQWIVQVNDVAPDGQAKNITSGWLSANRRPYDPKNPTKLDPAYRPFDPFYFTPYKAPSPIAENTLYPYVVEIWPTDNVFKKGHRIRLSILASDIPHILPTLVYSKNTLTIDAQNHPARLDCTVVRSDMSTKGKDWDWISDIMAADPKVMQKDNAVLREFTAMSQYLLVHEDVTTAAAEGGDGSTSAESAGKGAAAGTGSGGGGGGCFVMTAMH